MTKPYTAGPWHWVDGQDDEPLDMTGTDSFGYASLRTVWQFEKPLPEGWTGWRPGPLPVFIVNVDELNEGEEMAANYRLIAMAPELADFVYAHAAIGDQRASRLVAKIEGRDGPPIP